MLRRTHGIGLGIACCLLILAPMARAAGNGDRVQFGSNIEIAENESVGSVVCIFCSIRMQGSSGDVVAVLGSVLIDGQVSGDVVAIGGASRLTDAAKVAGDVVAIGGGVHRESGAKIGGDMVSQSGFLVLFLLFLVPLIPVVLIVSLIWWLLSRGRRPPVPVRA